VVTSYGCAGPSTRTSSGGKAGGDLGIDAVRTPRGDRLKVLLDPALPPAPAAAAPATRRYSASHAQPRVEAVAHLDVGAALLVSEHAVISVGVQSMTRQPRSTFPNGQPREPGRVAQISDRRASRTRPNPGDLVKGARIGPEAPASAATVVSDGGARRRLMMSQQRDVVHDPGPSDDRHRHGHSAHTPSISGKFPAQRQADDQRRGSRPDRPACAADMQHAPECPRQALALLARTFSL